jgi:FKBP-type peptidyl-prolyl cis-trans isomerase (trigger factor)
MNIDVLKLPNAEIKLTVTIPAQRVAEVYEKLVDKLVSESSIKGFRKGKAPKEAVLEKTDISKIHGDVVSELLKTSYPQVIKEKSIFPYSNPKIEVKEFDTNFSDKKDFIYEAVVAVKPEVTLTDYRNTIEELSKKKINDIEKLKNDLENGAQGELVSSELTVEEMIEEIVSKSNFEISELIINEETDRLLERFISQVRSLNLNVDSLLKAQNKTYEDLLADHKRIAEQNVKSEFVLNEIIKEQNIEANEEDIQNFIQNVGNEDLKNRLLNTEEKWFVKATIEKNRAVAYLKSLVTVSDSSKTEENTENENISESEEK